jgi:galactokinase
VRADPGECLREAFGAGGEQFEVAVPGRVNLIGEHIDYHGLPVLPMALDRRIRVAFRPRTDRRIRAVSAGFGRREFDWTPELAPAAPGDWGNYLRAAAQAVARKWGVGAGVDAVITSDLPPAAGLASSSALLVAFTLAFLRANRRRATLEELMEILPEGEQFVGTRGGGMDHAASLASRKGCASLIAFEPLSVRPIPIPADWGFLVAHSMRTAEKSGAMREAYNARRRWGRRFRLPQTDPASLTGDERHALQHVTGEARRVEAAVAAMERADAPAFGRLLLESHASLRDLLKVSCPELDRLVEAAMESGALGARLTGAGFGGCAVVFANKRDLPAIRSGLIERFYAGDHSAFLIAAEPGPGTLYMEDP